MGELIDFSKYLKPKEQYFNTVSDSEMDKMRAAIVYEDTLNETLILLDDLGYDTEEAEKYVEAVAFMASLVVDKLSNNEDSNVAYLSSVVEHLQENPFESIVVRNA